MDKIERIAKLHELRNAGGLTDEEFDRQKSRILAGPKWLIPLAVVAAVAAAGIAYFCIAPKYPASTSVPEAPARIVGQSSDLRNATGSPDVPPQTVPQPAVPTPTSSKLAQVFVPATLGARIAYLENMTGVARNAIGDMRTYNVEGCEIQALVRGASSMGSR